MPPRFRASAIYFLFFGAVGAFTPYLNLYYQSVGMTKQQIGILIAATTLMTVVASPLWSTLADAFRLHRYLLPVAMLGTLLPVGLLLSAADFWTLLLLILVYALFMGPVIPLTDNAVLAMLGDDRDAYGRIRLWGAIGFGLSAWGGGALAEQFGLSIVVLIFIGSMFLCGVFAMGLPAPQIDSSQPFLQNLRRLMMNPTWLGFLLAVLLVGVSTSFIHNYLVLYLTDLGAGEELYGRMIAIAGVSELPVFFFSALLMRHFSARGLIIFALAAFVVRSLLFSLIPSPEWATVPQLLHGPTFSALWAASVVYATRIAPPGLGATAQSSLGLALFGAAGVIGGPVGANIYDSWGPVALYQVGAIMAGLGLVCFLLVEMRTRRVHIVGA
jgi:MFS transporter, PPP family, 3-phenylpropionic acid transporter